jgi:periplasmic protein CpxP/Spy
MKRLISSILPVFALALLAVGPLARAQDTSPPPPPAGGDDQAPPPPHHHPHGLSAEQLKEKLSLTDDQFSKISALISSQKEQMQAIHEDDSLSDDDKRGKMRELGKSTHDQIRALLTPAQQKIFDALMPPHGSGGPPPPPPPPPPSE